VTDKTFSQQLEEEIAALQREMQQGPTGNADTPKDFNPDDLFGDFQELRKMVVENAGKEDARARQEVHREREAAGNKFKPQDDDTVKRKRREARDRSRQLAKDEQLEHIAVLDMETDPFDTDNREIILPFTACLYSETFKPIFIWEENYTVFVEKLCAAIEGLPGRYIIYAHNGGRFDFMFLMHKLRGNIAFKGRGIMSAQLGRHELRDSYHLIPEKLAAYKKDKFDYKNMSKKLRNNFKQTILDYLLSDCEYLYDIVKTFLQNYGIKISIGQAAMSLLKKEYPECQNISESEDKFYREWFFGGRVECFAGRGEWQGEYKLYDVNSMYPFVMAQMTHPIGKEYIVRNKGDIRENTCFIDLTCYSAGAFPLRNEDGGTHFPHQFGRFKVTVHEYKAALDLKLIKNVQIHYVVDNQRMTKFDRFILPIYLGRLETKKKLKRLERDGKQNSDEYFETKKDDIFLKLLMNNAYGKFAQNPRNFKEYHLTDWDGKPDEPGWGEFPHTQCEQYAIWCRPQTTLRFNNVGTSASITGAARSVLLRAAHNSTGLLYCDTDSLICKSLSNVLIHPEQLGAWDLEAEISSIMIAGKKLYAYETAKQEKRIKSKGTKGITWEQMQEVVNGAEIIVPAFAPTLTRDGAQRYIDRTVRATTKRKI
jgi:hypothetical protein